MSDDKDEVIRQQAALLARQAKLIEAYQKMYGSLNVSQCVLVVRLDFMKNSPHNCTTDAMKLVSHYFSTLLCPSRQIEGGDAVPPDTVRPRNDNGDEELNSDDHPFSNRILRILRKKLGISEPRPTQVIALHIFVSSYFVIQVKFSYFDYSLNHWT